MLPVGSSSGSGEPLGQRVYQALKREVLSERVVSGERLDLAQLADRHRASLTPVRAALHRLAGEGLVELFPQEGFRVAFVTERGLRDLYQAADRLAAQLLPTASRRGLEPEPPARRGAPSEVGMLFLALGELDGNLFLLETVRRLNDRLSRVRRCETRLIPDVDREADALFDALEAGHWLRLRRALHAYHQRRLREAARLVEALAAPQTH